MSEVLRAYMDYSSAFLGQIWSAFLDSLRSDSLVGQSTAEFSNIINSSDLVHTLKNISLVVSIILLIVFAIIYFKYTRIGKNKISIAQSLNPPQPAPSGALNNRWEEIKRHIESTREAEWKFAVIEADKLADDSLKRAGFPGETMGERMMALNPGQLESLNGLWDAHKTRNRVVHDANYFLRHAEARRAVNLYESTLRELGAID